MEEFQYLGHIISNLDIGMDLENLEVIKEWPVPRNIHELQSFIGMCAYYQRFIASFSTIAGPLHNITKKNVRFIKTSKQEEAFNMLKGNLISNPIFVLSDLTKLLEVQYDACGNSIGAVLLQ